MVMWDLFWFSGMTWKLSKICCCWSRFVQERLTCVAVVQVLVEEVDGDLLRTCFLPIFSYSVWLGTSCVFKLERL